MQDNSILRKHNDFTLIENINIIICVYICCWVLLPAFRNSTDSGIYRILFMGLLLLWFITTLMIKPKWINKFIPIIILWSLNIIFTCIYIFFGNSDINFISLVDRVFLLNCILMGGFYSELSKSKLDKIILSCVITCFIITAITTIYNLKIDINASRILTSSSTSDIQRHYLESRNVGSFDFIYGIILILPIILISIKNIKLPKNFIFIVLSILMLLCCILSNFSTIYILLIITFFIVLIPSNKNSKKILLILTPIIIILTPILLEVIIYILEIIKYKTPSIMTQIKIQGIIDVLLGQDSIFSLGSRISLYSNSIRSFLESPLIGIGAYYNEYNIIGGHSQFLDDLARYGIFVFLCDISFYFIYKKNIIKKINCIWIKNAYNFSWLYFIILGLINPIYNYGISLTMFLIIPVVIRYIQYNEL